MSDKVPQQDDMTIKITVSTVTPVYRGEKYLPDLVKKLSRIRESWEVDSAPIELVESIFADDGSQDSSSMVLRELAAEYPWVRVVTLSRNFGQHSATVAGICHSMGDWVVTLDEDLQHEPENIDLMLREAVMNEADIVYAKHDSGVHGSSWRDRGSVWAKKLIGKMSGVPMMPYFNSFRLIRGGIARAAASSCSSQTYLDVALSWFTRSVVRIPIRMRDERFVNEGASGYNLFKLIDHARKLAVNSNSDIARWGIVLGSASIFISVVLTAWVIFGKLALPTTVQAPGWASLLATISFTSGVAISLLTMILEYVSIMLVNQLGKPVFFTVDRASDSQLRKWYENRDVSDPAST